MLRWFNLLTVAVGLFVVGLNVPKVSQPVLFLVLIICLLISKKVVWRDVEFVIKSTILVCFASTYYGILYAYDFIDPFLALKNVLVIACAYLMGYFISDSDLPWKAFGVIWIFLASIAGFVVFSLGSVLYSIDQVGAVSALTSRKAMSIWGGEALTNGPVFGLYVSLGLCLVPLLFWGHTGIRGWHLFLIRLVIVAFGAAALYVQFYVRNRTPYIAFLTALVVSVFLYKSHGKTGKIMVVVLSVVGLAFLSFWLVPEDVFYVALGRFSDEGLETPRYESWLQMVRHLFDYPLGGRRIDLLGLNYVHNLWLDVAYNAGIFPFAFLLLFHLSHIRNLWVLVHSQLPSLVIGIIVCMGVSFSFGFMGEPALDASISYCAFSCMLLGTIHGFAKDIRYQTRWNAHAA